MSPFIPTVNDSIFANDESLKDPNGRRGSDLVAVPRTGWNPLIPKQSLTARDPAAGFEQANSPAVHLATAKGAQDAETKAFLLVQACAQNANCDSTTALKTLVDMCLTLKKESQGHLEATNVSRSVAEVQRLTPSSHDRFIPWKREALRLQLRKLRMIRISRILLSRVKQQGPILTLDMFVRGNFVSSEVCESFQTERLTSGRPARRVSTVLVIESLQLPITIGLLIVPGYFEVPLKFLLVLYIIVLFAIHYAAPCSIHARQTVL